MKLIRLLKNELAAEAKGWVEEELISEPQAQAILARYGTSLPDGRERSTGYYVLLSLAALFLGLAVLLIVSANWEDIPRAVRVGALVTLTAGSNAIGVRAFRDGRWSAAGVWLFFGSVLYGTSIMLIAQIYHLSAHYPDGIYMWALGVLPIAVLAGSVPCMLLSLGLASIWMGTEVGFESVPWSYPMFVAAAVGFAVWARRSVVLFLGAIAGGLFWAQVVVAWALDPAHSLEPSTDHGMLAAGAALLLDVLGRHLGTRPAPRLQIYGISLRLWVLRFALVSAVVFSFAGPWEELLNAEWRAPGLVTGWGVLVAVVTLGAAFARGRAEGGAAVLREAGSGLAFLAFAAIARGVVAVTQAEQAPVVLQVLTNLFAAGTGVWLVYRGIRDTITHYYYLGIATLIAIALCRYFDLIGDYVGGAVLFAACAGILFAAARYWRRQVGVEREVGGPEAKPA